MLYMKFTSSKRAIDIKSIYLYTETQTLFYTKIYGKIIENRKE